MFLEHGLLTLMQSYQVPGLDYLHAKASAVSPFSSISNQIEFVALKMASLITTPEAPSISFRLKATSTFTQQIPGSGGNRWSTVDMSGGTLACFRD